MGSKKVDARAELEKRTPRSLDLYQRSHQVLAREVVGTVLVPYPFYIRQAKGSRVIDVDDNEYIDLTMGYGPHILGHTPEVVVEAVKEAVERGLQWGLHGPYQEPLARLLVEAAPSADKVAFCNSGTEASLFAIRAARAYTGKTKIGVFDGSYHGGHDYVLVQADKRSPRERPKAIPRGVGIPEETLNQIIMLPYRHEAAYDLIRAHKEELAVVLIEPVQSSNPRLDCGDFLKELREVCKDSGVLFLMDEVITGFRLAYGGGQEYFGVTPDLVTYGKALGGGLPIGAVAGRADVMEVFVRRIPDTSGSPRIYSGGTFDGNPMTMATGYAAVSYMRDHPQIYPYLAEQGARLATAINQFCDQEELPAQLMSALSLFRLQFQRGPIHSVRDIDDTLKEAEGKFYLHLLNHGVVVPGAHLFFISAAHTPQDIEQVVDAFKQSFLEVRAEGLL